jgi:hypothetical protein
MITEGILLDSVGLEARDIMQAQISALNTIKKNLELAQERMKKNADKKRSGRELAVADMSYLKLQACNHIGTLHWEFPNQSSSIQSFMALSKCCRNLLKCLTSFSYPRVAPSIQFSMSGNLKSTLDQR